MKFQATVDYNQCRGSKSQHDKRAQVNILFWLRKQTGGHVSQNNDPNKADEEFLLSVKINEEMNLSTALSEAGV